MILINNLWRTYLFIVFISILSAVALLYAEWKDLVSETESELIYVNKIMSSSVESLLHKYEGMLGLLGDRLIYMDALNTSSPESKKLIKKLKKNHPELIGFSLANALGQQRLTTYSLANGELPNLLNSSETAGTFKQALIKDNIVVGRTYYMDAMKQWVIPLRYRILNNEGKVTAVMSTGLKLESTNNIWSSLNFPKHLIAMNVRKDLYRQYVPKRVYYTNKTETFSKPVSEKFVKDFERNLLISTGSDLAGLRQSGKTVILNSLFSTKRLPTYTSISYDKTYQSYTLIVTPVSILIEKMYQPGFRLLVIVLLFNSSLWWLFNNNFQAQEQSKKRLKYQAEHDALTNLPNRRNLLNNYTNWKQQHNAQFFVAFIDLNNFKSINDLHGHTAGDLVLIEVANRLNHYFLNCFKVRQGGDEFIILCPESIAADSEQYCEEFLQKLRTPILVGDLEFIVSASLGIATSPSDGVHIDELLRKADMAMYEAKRKGKSISIFSDELEQLELQKASIEKELTNALANNEFFMVYQPQVDAKTHQIIGVEALIRWNNPELGFVPPDKFISIAEATGLIIDIGTFVLEQSINQFVEICHGLKKDQTLRLSINISVHQLLNKDFFAQIKALTKIVKTSKMTIALEVTESLFIEDITTVNKILSDICQLGIEISLDDFGTGYSSLNVLNKLPINELKIDKSFVRDILTDAGDRELIQSIINLGKSLKIPTIAEGVEKLEQANLLLEYGCDLFQGYYYSKPLEINDLKKYMKRHE